MSAAGYHEVMYDDGDQYKGEWNAAGKVCSSRATHRARSANVTEPLQCIKSRVLPFGIVFCAL